MQFKLLAAVTCTLVASASAQTLDLLTAYRLSADSSPVVAQSMAQFNASHYETDIARSALGPRLMLEGSAGLNDLELSGFGPQSIDESYTPYNYRLSLTQPLLSLAAWSGLQSTRSTLQAREEELRAVRMDLMLQVSESYFSILRAQAMERAALTQQTLLKEMADSAESAYRTGSGDIIAVEDARARLDAAEAQLLSARNQVLMASRSLERLTHQPVATVADLDSLEPQAPAPDQLAVWEATATENQPLLIKAQLEVQANYQLADAADRSRWPVVSLNAEYGYSDGVFAPDINRRESLVGISAAWPLFQGGEINATKARAEALALASRYAMENLEDQVRLETQRAFLDLQNSVAQLTATKRAFQSSTTALGATRKGQEVGSRTVADVLDSAQRHARAESDYYLALYNHVLARLRLKAAAGVLDETDIAEINALLFHPVGSESL